LASPTTSTQALNQLVIQSTQILPQAAPSITLGEILRLTVRQNTGQGQGMLYFKGNLIKADIPPDLTPGDHLMVKVTGNEGQLVLKILDILKPGQAPSIQYIGQTGPQQAAQPTAANALSSMIRSELERILKGPDTTAVGGAQPQTTAVDLSALSKLRPEIKNALLNLIVGGNEPNAQAAHAQLLASTNGSLVFTLKESASALQTLLAQGTMSPTERLLQTIYEEIASLLRERATAETAQHQIAKAAQMITQHLRESKELSETEVDKLHQTRELLKDVLGNPAKINESLEKVLSQLDKLGAKTEETSQRLDPKTASELERLATHLEQMAQTQETLNRLNPLMHAIGEPALILFPFLLQGLLTHSEVTIGSRSGGKKKQQKSGQSEGDEEESAQETKLYQRIQVRVPLPELGIVDVDIAHRDREILARFTVETQEVGAFLLEQLEHLAITLKEQGFEHAELVANVGQKNDDSPLWSLGLHSSTSVVA